MGIWPIAVASCWMLTYLHAPVWFNLCLATKKGMLHCRCLMSCAANLD